MLFRVKLGCNLFGEVLGRKLFEEVVKLTDELMIKDILDAEKLKKIKTFIDAGADLKVQNKNGETALMYMLFWTEENMPKQVLNMLLFAGSDVNFRNEYGRPPLMYGTAENAKQLIDAGADVSFKPTSGPHESVISAFSARLSSIYCQYRRQVIEYTFVLDILITAV